MDKLKQQIAPYAVYIFWGVLGVVILGSTAVWWLASADLAKQITAQTSAVKSGFQNVQTLQGKAGTHPNSHSHGNMEQRVAIAKSDVRQAWEKQFNVQKEILVWSNELNQKGTKDFTSIMERMLPIETKTEYPVTEKNRSKDVRQNMRKRYKLYVERTLPELADIVGAKWTADFKAAAAAGGMMMPGMGGEGGGGMTGFGDAGGGDDMMSSYSTTKKDEPETLITWGTESQESLLQQMFPWRHKQEPDTVEILYSQEDLWVAKGLLQIVAATNYPAKKRFQAVVREIMDIKIGKSVAGRVGSVQAITEAPVSGGGDGYGEEMFGGSSPETSSGPGGGEGGIGGAAVSIDPAEKRYVDNEYKPITASDLRSAMKSDNPSKAFINVAKRLPVMLKLRMDQRKLPKLLAACGNAKLQVEVRQVRINASGGASMAMNMMAAMGGGGGDDAGPGGMGGEGGGESAAPTTKVEDKYPYDLPIEVYGVIYLYNPVDMEKLGIEAVTTETKLEGKTIGETTEETPQEAGPDAAQTPPADDNANPATPTPADATTAATPEAGTTPAAEPQPAVPAPATPAPSGPPAPAPAAP